MLTLMRSWIPYARRLRPYAFAVGVGFVAAWGGCCGMLASGSNANYRADGYNRAHLDTGADMDSHGGTHLDTRAYMDSGTDLHANACANMDPGAHGDSDRYAYSDRYGHSYCYAATYPNSH